MLIRFLLLALLLPPVANAGPIDWAKRQVREHPVRTRFVTTAIAGAIYAEGLHQCRLVNVENCDAHYGAAWGSYAATMGLDAVGQIVGYKVGGKTGDAISYGGTAGVLAWGAYQWNGGLNKPPERKDNEKVDLSHVSFVRK